MPGTVESPATSSAEIAFSSASGVKRPRTAQASRGPTPLIPISVWLMKSYLDAIPRELDEAGLTDGAGRIRVFLELVLPVSLPGLVAVILFVFVKASQEFIYASTFISEPNLKTAPAGLYLFLTEIGVEWSNLAAAGLLVVLPVVLIFLLLQRWFVGGLTAGAVK